MTGARCITWADTRCDGGRGSLRRGRATACVAILVGLLLSGCLAGDSDGAGAEDEQEPEVVVLSVVNDRNTVTEWSLRVLSASRALPLGSYTFVYEATERWTLRIEPDDAFGAHFALLPETAGSATIGSDARDAPDCTAHEPGAARIEFADTDRDGVLSPTDAFAFTYATEGAGPCTFGDRWPTGHYRLSVVHEESGATVRQMERNV